MTPERALFANDAFYLAFTYKDIAAMERLWAHEHPVICVHPGWRALTDRADVMESWRRILENPQQPGIDFYNTQAHEVGDMVLVSCYEEIAGSVCVASNGFIDEEGEVRLCLHHAGHCPNPPEPTSAQNRH